jgi:hypothetical protein
MEEGLTKAWRSIGNLLVDTVDVAACLHNPTLLKASSKPGEMW